MTRRWSAVRHHLTRADAGLFVVGMVGFLCFLFLLPSQHPDSAATYEQGEADVVARARRAVDRSAWEVPSNARQTARLQRNAALLDSLQHDVGRPEAVRLLEGPAAGRLPGYPWLVEWKAFEGEEEAAVRISLTRDGRLYGLDVRGPVPLRDEEDRFDRAALTFALASEGEGRPSVTGAPDSTLQRIAAALQFDLGRTDTARADEQVLDEALARIVAEATEGGTRVEVYRMPSLGRAAAEQLARYHLQRTAFRDRTLSVDTVVVDDRSGGLQVATVRFQGVPVHGQHPRVDVEVLPSGVLVGIDPAFNAEGDPLGGTPRAADAEEATGEEEEDSISIDLGADTVRGVVAFVLYVALFLVSFVVFFRRLRARVVDTRLALRDALWGGLFASAFMGFVMAGQVAEMPEVWMAVVATSLTAVVTGAGGAFLVFIASGAMDSVARATWSEKLVTLDLVRHGAFRNVLTGAALLRGAAGGGALLGLIVLLLALLPTVAISFGSMGNSLGNELHVSMAGATFGAAAWFAQFVMLTVFLGVGTWLYRWRRSRWTVVAGLALVLVLMKATLAPLAPMWGSLLIDAAFALGWAALYWRYDFVVAFLAYLCAALLMGTTTGWLVDGSPAWVDTLLAFSFVAAVVVVGLVGLLSGRLSTEVGAYVPDYIQELAEEERIKRDIEIAQEVQQNFLPRQMPRVPHVDLAAMCLPAQEVGGDYYDFIPMDDGRLGVVIGDVSGKGIQAAFFMTLVKGFVQTLAHDTISPRAVLRRLNDLFYRNAMRGTFISMIYGIADVEAQTFTFARAGHNPLLYRPHDADRVEALRPPGLAIGLTRGPLFDDSIEEAVVPLRPGDTLVVYTDGFSEAVNAAGEQFGDDRIAACFGERPVRAAAGVLRSMSEAVHLHAESASRADDMTMIVLRHAPHHQEGAGDAPSTPYPHQTSSTHA